MEQDVLSKVCFTPGRRTRTLELRQGNRMRVVKCLAKASVSAKLHEYAAALGGRDEVVVVVVVVVVFIVGSVGWTSTSDAK